MNGLPAGSASIPAAACEVNENMLGLSSHVRCPVPEVVTKRETAQMVCAVAEWTNYDARPRRS